MWPASAQPLRCPRHQGHRAKVLPQNRQGRAGSPSLLTGPFSATWRATGARGLNMVKKWATHRVQSRNRYSSIELLLLLLWLLLLWCVIMWCKVTWLWLWFGWSIWKYRTKKECTCWTQYIYSFPFPFNLMFTVKKLCKCWGLCHSLTSPQSLVITIIYLKHEENKKHALVLYISQRDWDWWDEIACV